MGLLVSIKTTKISLTYVTIKKIFIWIFCGIFVVSWQGKNSCDGAVLQNERWPKQVSSNLNLTKYWRQQKCFNFAKNISKESLTFTYKEDEEIIQYHNSKLLDWFENCVTVTDTRSFQLSLYQRITLSASLLHKLQNIQLISLQSCTVQITLPQEIL